MPKENTKHTIHVCSIGNHPIAQLPEKYRTNYVEGLSSILFKSSGGNAYVQMLCNVWCESILGKEFNSFQDNPDAEKRALSLNRIKFHFFRMKYEMIFDAFYLTEVWDKSKLNDLKAFLAENVFKGKSKAVLNEVHAFFSTNEKSVKIPQQLVKHRLFRNQVESTTIKKILVVANVSAGKSTLINALTGYNLNQSSNRACTNDIKYLYNKDVEDGATLLSIGGRKYQYVKKVQDVNSNKFQSIAFHFNSSLGDSNVCLIDTPGVNNIEQPEHGRKTMEAIASGNYDALLFVSNAKYFGTNDDYQLLKQIAKTPRVKLIFVLNKLDAFKQKEDSIKEMLDNYKNDLTKMGFIRPMVVPVSSLTALLLKNESRLDEESLDELASMKKRFSKEYYDLPSYINGTKSCSMIDATGITLLEEAIMKI